MASLVSLISSHPLPALVSSTTTPSSAATSDTFSRTLASHGLVLGRLPPRVLQINVGRLCNLTCVHCHVNAGPTRTEIMTDETVDRILDWVERTSIQTIDLTGGAPEMVPAFRRMISRLSAMKPRRHIIDRCNLTILLEPGYEGLAEFLAENRVEIVASMPCYSPENVNAQRGEGVFDASISALKHLNALGYGREDDLPLHLVYNPLGATLPPDQAELEAEYKAELRAHFGIEFHCLYTITNMVIARFASWLKRNGTLAEYQQLLIDNFNPGAVNGLMCRDTISIDWEGHVYDCDFNQQLCMRTVPAKLWELRLTALDSAPILTGEHCFGCTAGSGSSCGGSLIQHN